MLTNTVDRGCRPRVEGAARCRSPRRRAHVRTLTGRSYTQAVSYDGISRVKRVVYPVTGLTLQNNYNTAGYLQTITEPANGSKVHWQALGRFDDGQISQMQYGINASTGGVFTSTRSYDSQGRISGISTIPTAGAGGGSTAIQNASFTFDAIGNLTSRSDSAPGVSLAQENFTYDLLNRLTSVSGGAGANKTHTYDSFGNLTTRTDTGSYTYQAGTHRLQNVTGGIATGNTVQSYSYNSAGDITQISGGNINGGGTRTITPSAFSVPLAISQPSSNHTNGTLSIQYGYTGDRVRLTERRPNRPTATPSNQHVNLTTYLLAGSTALFEEDRLGAGNSSEPFRYRYKHSINTPEGTVSIVVIDAPWGGSGSSSMRSDRTFHRDHLGSTVAITDENGTEFLGYDAWGKRRNANGQDNNIAAWVGLSSKTDRGYTGHEHIDDIGLIHMNGRLYDPITGRMMSADPIIQAPYLLQNYNRYSYVMNNPLSLTDPSGFSWWTRHRRTIGAIAAIIIFQQLGAHYAAQAGTEAAAAGANAASAAAQTQAFFNSIGGFAAGGIGGGNVESAVIGAITGGFTTLAGELAGVVGAAGGSAGAVGIHAVVGCMGASISGGDCGRGAVSAGFSEMAIPSVHDFTQSYYARVALMSAAGGIGSRLAGGNFANGAVTGAFVYMFNYCSHGQCTSDFEQFMYDWWPGYKFGTAARNGAIDSAMPSGEEITDVASLFPGGGKLAQMAKGAAKGAAKPTNQLNAEIYRGQAPDGIKRVDDPRTYGEQKQVHFDDKKRSALNIDGTWKHGGMTLSNAQREWLVKHGWKLPK
ncbi:MAG: RHS repeat-associated core domain-containing protein [Betaproteobacteria bacterium]